MNEINCPGKNPTDTTIYILDSNGVRQDPPQNLSLINFPNEYQQKVLKGNNLVYIPENLLDFSIEVTLYNKAGRFPYKYPLKYGNVH